MTAIKAAAVLWALALLAPIQALVMGFVPWSALMVLAGWGLVCGLVPLLSKTGARGWARRTWASASFLPVIWLAARMDGFPQDGERLVLMTGVLLAWGLWKLALLTSFGRWLDRLLWQPDGGMEEWLSERLAVRCAQAGIAPFAVRIGLWAGGDSARLLHPINQTWGEIEGKIVAQTESELHKFARNRRWPQPWSRLVLDSDGIDDTITLLSLKLSGDTTGIITPRPASAHTILRHARICT